MNGITIYDIAREAEVSPATVSRVLTNNARVSDKKRQVVEKVIKKYNFKPNAVAQGLSGGTRVIGLMVADIRNPYYSALAIECETAAKKYGYTVLLCNMLMDDTIENDLLEKFYSQRVEAIIQIGRRTDLLVSDPAYAKLVRRLGIPFITTGKLDGIDHYSVRINHTQSMEIVMDYLISLGHREIALVGGEKCWHSTYEKWNQYECSMKKYKLKPLKDFFLEGRYDDVTGYACMERLLKAKTIPSAVIAINDECALGVILAAQDHGLTVPDDMSVVGFDNTSLATLTRPKLTTVDYNYSLYGETLVDTAVQAAQGKNPLREILLNSFLVVRESCCPAGK